MNEKEIMSEEAFKELIDNLEIVEKLTPYGRKAIKYWVTKLQKENEKYKYLYQKALDNTVKSDKENMDLKKQIDLMIEEYEYNDRINFKDFCEDELRKDKCIQDCKIYVKQYFETKAKKGE